MSFAVPDLAPEALHRDELLIKRSRFIVSLGHCPDTEQAKAFVERVRGEFPDATHNCWAYVAGPPGSTSRIGMSDDGEPHGTAGRPMLTVLLHCGIGEIGAVVTRYFGGIKLGTGGLVRAYQDSVRLGLDTLPTREHMITTAVRVVLDYPHITRFHRLLPRFRATVDHELFGVDATFTLSLPEEAVPDLTAELTELTDGAVLVEPVEQV